MAALQDAISGISTARALCDKVMTELDDVIFHKYAIGQNIDRENALRADALEQESDYDGILQDLTAANINATAVTPADIDAVNAFLLKVQNYALADAVAEGGLDLFQNALDAADQLVGHATGSPPPATTPQPTTAEG
jgi:hypothetical protein